MTTVADPQVRPVDTDFEGDHLYCCNHSRSLCGFPLDPDDPDCPEDCGHPVCELCATVDAVCKQAGGGICCTCH